MELCLKYVFMQTCAGGYGQISNAFPFALFQLKFQTDLLLQFVILAIDLVLLMDETGFRGHFLLRCARLGKVTARDILTFCVRRIISHANIKTWS